MNQQYVEKLESAIDEHLNNITRLQAALVQEEKKLQQCLRELRFHESNYEITSYHAHVTAIA